MAVRRQGETQFPLQMTMFEQAGTLDTEFTHNDVTTANPALGDIRSLKLRESLKPGSAVTAHGAREQFIAARDGVGSLRDSIAEEGVKAPIDVRISPAGTKDVANGHHRMYTAADLNPNMEVPVTWDDHRTPMNARLGEMQHYLKNYNRHMGMDEAVRESYKHDKAQQEADAKALNL